MATYNSDAIDAGLMPTPYGAGQVVCRSATYTNDGAKAAGSIIKMVPIPEGAKLLRIEYSFTALGSGRTADIGYSDDMDHYVDGADVSSATTGSVVAINQDFSSDDYIAITILGNTLPDAAVLKLNAYYKMKDMIKDEA